MVGVIISQHKQQKTINICFKAATKTSLYEEWASYFYIGQLASLAHGCLGSDYVDG